MPKPKNSKRVNDTSNNIKQVSNGQNTGVGSFSFSKILIICLSMILLSGFLFATIILGNNGPSSVSGNSLIFLMVPFYILINPITVLAIIIPAIILVKTNKLVLLKRVLLGISLIISVSSVIFAFILQGLSFRGLN